MRVIVEADKNIVNAWGHPKPKDVTYRPMKYLLKVQKDEGTYLHNVVTGELIFLSEEETIAFEALPGVYTPTLDGLIAGHFAVAEGYDEHKSVLQIKSIMSKVSNAQKKHITGYTILPTTNCNARCFYCYEANVKHVNMSEETAHQAVEFIKNHCGGEKVHLNWFGGEPTVAAERIDQICDELTEAGIEYSSGMISNGYLLDADMADKAKKLWKLQSIQITLDGTEEIYNRVKAYRAVQGSPYKTVLANIGGLLEREIKVNVRMNLDRHNADNLRELIDELINRFGENSYFRAYVFPLFDDCGFNPVEHSDEDHHWLLARQAELNEILTERSVHSSGTKHLPSTGFVCCMADSSDSVIIRADGMLSKCEHEFMNETIGTIWDGVTDTVLVKQWTEQLEHPECAECPLCPNCHVLKKCFNTTSCLKEQREAKVKSALKAVYGRCHPADA